MKQEAFGKKKRITAIALAAALLFGAMPQVNTVVWAENEAGGGTEEEGGTETETGSQSLDGYTFSVSGTKTYDGTAITINDLSGLNIIAQKEGAQSVALTAGENCEIEMKSEGEWKNAGNYELLVKQKEGADYTFEDREITYRIEPFHLSDDSVKISTDEIWWTGDKMEEGALPKVEVKNEEHVLLSEDYQITYKKQGDGGAAQPDGEVKDAGTYEITVMPAGTNLKSENGITKTFQVKYDESVTDESFSVNGGVKKGENYYYKSEVTIRPSDGYEILEDGISGGAYQDGAVLATDGAQSVTFRIRTSDRARGREFTVSGFVKDVKGPLIAFREGSVHTDQYGTMWGGSDPKFEEIVDDGIGAEENPEDDPKIECRVNDGEWRIYGYGCLEGLANGTKCEFRAYDLLDNVSSPAISFLLDGGDPEVDALFGDKSIDFNEEGNGILHVKDKKIISFTLEDSESGIDPQKTQITVDGESFAPEASDGEISWNPSDPNAPQYSIISITAGDYIGNSSERKIFIYYDPKKPEIGEVKLNGGNKSEIKASENVTVSAVVEDDSIYGEEQLESVNLVNTENKKDVTAMTMQDGEYRAIVEADGFLSGTYQIVAKDQAGNESKSDPFSIFIAERAPEILSVGMDSGDDGCWTNKNITFTVEVDEPGGWPDGTKYCLQFQKVDAGNDVVDADKADSLAWDYIMDENGKRAEASRDDVKRTFSYLEKDNVFHGTYYFRIQDEAGNLSACQGCSVKKDRVKPNVLPGEILAQYSGSDSSLDGGAGEGTLLSFIENLKRFFDQTTITATLYIPQEPSPGSGIKSIEYKYGGLSKTCEASVDQGETALINSKQYAIFKIEGLPKQAADAIQIMKITDFAGNEQKQSSEAEPVAKGNTVLVIDNVSPKLSVDYLDSDQKWNGKKAEYSGRKYYGRIGGAKTKEIKLIYEERFFEENKDGKDNAIYPVVKINGKDATSDQISWGKFDKERHTVSATIKLSYEDNEEAEYVITTFYQDGSKNVLLKDDPFWHETAKDGGDEYESGIIILDDKAPEISFQKIYTDENGKAWGGKDVQISTSDSGVGMPDPARIEYRAGEGGTWILCGDAWYDSVKTGTKCYFRAADQLGNQVADNQAAFFYLDKDAPGIGVSFGKALSFNQKKEATIYLTQKELKNGAAVFSIEINDNGSGIKEEFVEIDSVSAEIIDGEIAWTPDDENESQYAVLSIEASDHIGNGLKQKWKVFIYYDPNKPEINNVQLNGQDVSGNKGEIKTTEDVLVSADVTDDIINNEKQLKTVELVNTANDADRHKMSSPQEDDKYQVVVTADVFLSGTYKIVAKDLAGNTYESKQFSIYIAKETPEILTPVEINRTPNPDGWIKDDITFTVKVNEPDGWPEDITYWLQYQKKGTGQAVSESWETVKDNGKEAEPAKDGSGQISFSYQETDETFDGYYIFRIETQAGNVSTPSERISIKKDKVRPEVAPGDILVWYDLDPDSRSENGKNTPVSFLECLKHLFAKHEIKAYLYIPQDRISGIQSIEYIYSRSDGVCTKKAEKGYAAFSGGKEYAEFQLFFDSKQTADTLIITRITDFAGNKLTQIQGTTFVAESNTILVIDNKSPELHVNYLDSDQKWEDKKGSDMEEPVAEGDDGRPRKYYARINGEEYKEIKLTYAERFFEENADEESDEIIYPVIKINDAPASDEMVEWGKFENETITATIKLPYIDKEEKEYVITTSYQDGSKNKLLMNPDDAFWHAAPKSEALQTAEKEGEGEAGSGEDGGAGNLAEPSGEYQSGVIVLDDAAPEFASYAIKEAPMTHEIGGVKVYANKLDGNDVTISFSIQETSKYWHKENVQLVIRDLTHGKEIVSVTGKSATLTEENNGNGNIHMLSYRFDGEPNVAANYRAEISYTDMAGNAMVKSEDFELAGGRLEEGTYQSWEFILDHAVPLFEINCQKAYRLVSNSDSSPSKDQMDEVPKTGYTAYFKTDIDVTLTIQEEYAHTTEKENGTIGFLSDFSLDVSNTSGTPKVDWKYNAASHQYTGTFTLSAEGQYQIKISYKDAAGNAMVAGKQAQGMAKDFAKGKYTGETLVIDKTAPVITTAYTNRAGNPVEPSYTQDGRRYFNQKSYLKVEVRENNFRNYELKDSLKRFSAYTIEQPDRQASTQAEKYIEGIADEKVDHSPVRSWSIPLTTEAYYDMPIVFEDLAGNMSRAVTEHSCVDTGKPGNLEFSYSVEKAGYLEIHNYKDFGYAFADHKLAVKVSANDSISGIRAIEFTVTDENGKTSVITKKYKPCFSKKASISLPISGSSFKGSVRAKVTDYASNASKKEQGQVVETADQHKKSGSAVITTKTKPSRSVDGEDYYNSDVELNVTLQDTYSGIGSFEYEAGSAIKESKNYKEAAGVDTREKAAQKIIHKISRNITLASQENNENEVQVSASFTDNAGHVSKAKEMYNIDITEPVIKVTYDLNDPLNEKYYKDTRTATVVITERNFDENDVEFTITNTDGAMPDISNFETSGSGDETTHTATVTFSEDGDYTFGLSFMDLAGNTAEYENEDEFTIDKTLPQYTVTYDNDSASNEYYYDAGRTVTVDVLEHNFDPASVTATVTKDNSSAGAPSFSGWSQNGDHNTATVTFAEDGEYTFSFTGMDLAGNEMDEYAQDHFVVDVTEPEIEIFNIENMSANNGRVQPGIRYHDTNYDANATVVEMTGFHNGKVEMGGTTAAVSTGVEIKMDDFAYRQEMDDLYTMRATVYDRAGNSSEAEVTFSVNRFGSVYTFDTDTDDLVGDEGAYYTNEKQDIVVTETNVDTLGFKEITLNFNGELSRLTEGEDYTVSKSGSDASWQQYTYTIGKDLFEKEGSYALTIYSEDQATNKSDNNTKGKQVEFVLDQTSPSVLVSGVKDNGQYREDSKTVTIDAEDNVRLANVVVNADGQKKTYKVEQLEETDGKIQLAIPSKNDWQTLEVTAYDAAGNEPYVLKEIRYLVTSNFWIQFMANKPLFYGSLAAVSILILGVFLLVMARRRKKEEE